MDLILGICYRIVSWETSNKYNKAARKSETWNRFMFRIDASLISTTSGYALVRPFLYFDHFHIFDLLLRLVYFELCTSTHVLRLLYFDPCTSTYVLRTLYFELCTSTRLLRPFVKSGFLIGREAQVEVQFWLK